VEHEELVRALEAVLFASSEPVSVTKLEEVFAPGEVDRDAIREALETLQGRCSDRGIEIRELAGGYQMRTRPEMAPWVGRLETQRPVKFSRAALETLAIVVYRQPVTRAEVEEVRGVDCGGVLKTLLEKGLARIVGRKDVPGRPLLYGSTRRFLEVFGLGSLSELPSLRDVEEILAEQGEGGEEAEDNAP
jgi:segregation and condensation protein B